MNDPDDQAVLPPLDQLHGTDAGLDPTALDSMLAVATDPSTPDPGVDTGLDGLSSEEDVDLADLGDPADPADQGDIDETDEGDLDLPPLHDELAPLDDDYSGDPGSHVDTGDYAEHMDPGDLDDPLADL